MQVLDYGYEHEAWLHPGEDPFAPSRVRLCTPCYEHQGRYRVGGYGDFLLGEEPMCKAHAKRKKAGVSEEAMKLPIGKQGRPRVALGACTVEGCDKPQRTKGLCNTHYVAKWRASK